MTEQAQAPSQTETSKAAVFAVKTTANQERSVANLIAMVARKENYDIRAILVPEELKGYVLVESPMHEIVEHAIQNIPHAKAVVKGASSIAEVEHFLAPKPAVTGIAEGDIVELVSGPFKGERARVKRVDEAKEEITVELSEAMVPIPVTVRGDIVRVLSKEEVR
jgi:transcriptional antiterminator NusG